MRKLLIFDWDGTLCDSLHRIAYCLQLAADDAGLPVPELDSAKDIIGLGLHDALQRLFPGLDDLDAIQALRDCYAEHFRREDSSPSPLFANVQNVLDTCRSNGYLLAVATGKSRAGLDRVLGSLGMMDYFDATRCADETAAKPNPLMLESLLAEYSLPATQALMVGDTTFDMEMAQRSGMPRVAVSYGAHDANRLSHYRPLACIGEFEEILNLLYIR